ncbi:MAG TPA: NADH-quinone oxidoreductase subunit J [Acidimicrobiia bacterium]|nr:NADH-quinone oxidoreductase subunit J [Acidimicrobiia bacterium]
MEFSTWWEWTTDWLSDAQNIMFLVIALVMVVAAFRVVTSPNVVHAALMLVLALGGSAALFLMLGAEFVAWTLVLVYIGAVVVLFLFGIMITRAPTGRDPVRLDHERRWPAALVALGTFLTLAIVSVAAFEDQVIEDSVSRTGDLGDVLFSRFVIPFEAVSFVLLSALIGGIVIARKDPEK